MNDLISRQAAIDAIKASTSKYTGFMEMEMYTDDDAVEAIEALPSAHPKHGRWIYKEYPPTGTDAIGFFVCSECGHANWIKEDNYCPNCGALMSMDEVSE